jgi:hypothetical protein
MELRPIRLFLRVPVLCVESLEERERLSWYRYADDHLFALPLSLLFLAGCFAALCPCVVHSRNRQHLRSLQYQGTPLPAAEEKLDEHCCIYGALVITGYQWLLNVRPEDVDSMRFRLIPGVCSFALAKKSVSAMVFVAARIRTASPRGAAVVVRSHRSTGKSSWRRGISSEGGTDVVFARCSMNTTPPRAVLPSMPRFYDTMFETLCHPQSESTKLVGREFERIHVYLL